MLLVIDLPFVIEKFVLILVVVMGSLGIAMYTTFAERKVAAILQDRRGPNRAGPFGLLQPLADGLKLFVNSFKKIDCLGKPVDVQDAEGEEPSLHKSYVK